MVPASCGKFSGVSICHLLLWRHIILGNLQKPTMLSRMRQGKYFAVKDASVKVLEGYSKVGPAVVPQLFFFSLLFTILAAVFSFEALYGSGLRFGL